MTALTIPGNATTGDVDILFDPAGDTPVGFRRARDGKQWALSDPATAGGGTAATGYKGTVASQAAMIALTADPGATCLRSDVGATGTSYELKVAPASVAGNWQALSGTIADGTLVTLTLVAGKLPRIFRIYVPSGEFTVTVGGVTLPVFPASAIPHVIDIDDEPGVVAPTTVTVQRTSGSSTTGWYNLSMEA